MIVPEPVRREPACGGRVRCRMNRAEDPAAPPLPYSGLTPELVLDAMDAVGLRGDGRLLQLNSYENRVFQIFLEDGRVVVAKFYRPNRWTDAQILEEHAFAAELAADECPVVPPLLLTPETGAVMTARLCGGHSDQGTLAAVDTASGDTYRFAVSDRCAGRAPELEDEATLAWVGRFIGRIHSVGRRRAFAHRRTLDVAEFGYASRDWLIAHGSIPPELLPPWQSAVDRALEATERAFARLAGDLPLWRVHGDCHVGNLLWTATGPHFVDLDDTLMAPPVQDLWLMLSGEPVAARRQLGALLSGYEQFVDFDDRQLALIEPLRTLRMIHHSAWLARRWNDRAFQTAFPWFGQPSYWSQQTIEIGEQVELMRV